MCSRHIRMREGERYSRIAIYLEDYDEEETLFLQVRYRLWGHEELEKKCTLLNDDMMLIEDRGRIFFARREGWMSGQGRAGRWNKIYWSGLDL